MEQEELTTPKVFVSHASEDKDRFVIAFAKKLRDNGINAWVDKWEIHPGDSLVDKIFEVGIGGAQAIIIVLSRNSVEKPWVRQELDAGIVQRIQRGTKIIPIVLDDCEVPISLQSTVYVKIVDLNHYEAEFKSVVDAIYEYSEKPALGSPPSYIQTMPEKVPGFKRIDSLLLKLAGDKAIENGHRISIETQEMLDKAMSQGISRHNFYESLTVLGDRGFFELNRVFGGEPSEPELKRLTRGGVPDFSITIDGFEQYARAFIPNYQSIVRGVGLQIVNYDKSDSASIASELNQPLRVVDHVLERMDQRGLIKIIEEFGPETTSFMNVSPELRRLLEDDF